MQETRPVRTISGTPVRHPSGTSEPAQNRTFSTVSLKPCAPAITTEWNKFQEGKNG